MNLVIEPRTEQLLETIKASLPHALLLTGKKGVGLQTIAGSIPANIPVLVEPRLLTKTSTTPQISIDMIRELYTALRSKSTELQYIIIDDADSMTVAAQNSFLKLLEEPPAAVRFILTCHHPEQLLTTIRSRLQTLYIPPCTAEQTETLLAAQKSILETEKRQVLFIAQGLPAEIIRIASDKTYKEQVMSATANAKRLLQSPPSERAIVLSSLTFDKQSALLLIEKMIFILQKMPTSTQTALLGRLIEAARFIRENGNVRLQLAAAVL